jgi:hypothetical protein
MSSCCCDGTGRKWVEWERELSGRLESITILLPLWINVSQLGASVLMAVTDLRSGLGAGLTDGSSFI